MKHSSEKRSEVTEVSGKAREPRGKMSKKSIITLAALGVVCAVLVALLGVGIHFYTLLKDPGKAFRKDTGTATTAAAMLDTVTTAQTTAAQTTSAAEAETTSAALPETTGAAPTEATLSAYEQLQAQADYSLMKGIVNVLLVGVDYAPERDTWNGKHDYHADVMLVLAIDFDNNKVDMISIPRDTYAMIPGVNGKYKINTSVNCGGGFPDGLPKVCEAARWMLGDIPVDYYFAVTMPVVKELVDAVGGVDYDLEMDFAMAGRQYRKGTQFMNGQAVLDYLRVRKNVEKAGDLNRINRQKRMLVTLFDACKQRNLVVKFPDIVRAFDGKLYTNMNADQVVALALFAYNLPKDNIAMHSMGGASTDIYNWLFILTDQDARVKLIKEIYGKDVPKEVLYSRSYCEWEWANMTADTYLAAAIPLQEYADKVLREDRAAAQQEKKTTTTTTTPAAAEETTAAEAPSGGRKYSAEADALLARLQDEIYQVQVMQVAFGGTQKDLEKAAVNRRSEMIQKADELTKKLAELRADANKLKPMIGYSGKLNWAVKIEYDIDVDFR